MRIVICDDHRLVGDALALVLRMAGHDVIAVVEHPSAAEAVLRAQSVDVGMIDLSYGDATDIDQLAAMFHRYPSTRMIVLSGHLDNERIEALRRAGAASCAMKGGRMEDLVHLVESQGAGTALAAEPVDRWLDDPLARFLTPRERQVLDGLAAGDTTAMLAGRLGMSRTTLRTHVQSILSKLGVHSRLEAVSYAISRSLVVNDRRWERWEMTS